MGLTHIDVIYHFMVQCDIKALIGRRHMQSKINFFKDFKIFLVKIISIDAKHSLFIIIPFLCFPAIK